MGAHLLHEDVVEARLDDLEAGEPQPRGGGVQQRLRIRAVLELDLQASSAAEVIHAGLHEFLDDVRARLLRIDAAVATHIFRALPEEPVP